MKVETAVAVEAAVEAASPEPLPLEALPVELAKDWTPPWGEKVGGMFDGAAAANEAKAERVLLVYTIS